MGHCYDSCGWTTCGFWGFNDKTDESQCKMFNAGMFKSESLNICNKVYGRDYRGSP